MRAVLVFILLWILRLISRTFFRYRLEWISDHESAWHRGVRVLAVLNHTSLYEPLLVGFASTALLWDLASHGVLPVAEKTMKRPIGRFFAHLVRHVVVVTRQRDHTWDEVLHHVDQKALVIILPEGRMMRRNGLDSKGRPMTVRGGIVDILETLQQGRLLIVYSGGLHHIQAPGERLPRLFRTIQGKMEILEIEEYLAQMQQRADGGSLKAAIVDDLQQRRDLHCPPRRLDPLPVEDDAPLPVEDDAAERAG